MNIYPIIVILILIFSIGIIANPIVIYLLCRHKRKWHASKTLMLNLAAADSLLLCMVPIWLYHYLSTSGWSMGEGTCKLALFGTSMNMYTSSLFVMAMSVDRWLGIALTSRGERFRTPCVTHAVCLAIWLLAFVLNIPILMYATTYTLHVHPSDLDTTLVTTESSSPFNVSMETTMSSQIVSEANETMVMAQTLCDLDLGQSHRGVINFLFSVISFVIPFLVIGFCNFRLMIAVKGKMMRKYTNQKKFARLIVFLTGALFLCWVPLHIMNLYTAIGFWGNQYLFLLPFYEPFYSYAICLSWANSCINPIAYALITKTFQRKIKELCGKSLQDATRTTTTESKEETNKIENNTVCSTIV